MFNRRVHVAAATAAVTAMLGVASTGLGNHLSSRDGRPFGLRPLNARPLTSSLEFFAFGGSLAESQWRVWLERSGQFGCYAASGTGGAQDAFLSGGLGNTTETVTAPQTADCVSPNAGNVTYPEVDFSTGDAPLSVAQNNAYRGSAVYGKRGRARVAPVAGAALAEAFNASGLPANLTISNAQLCGIWQGTIANWSGVTNQATGAPASLSSLPISLVYGSDSSGSTFIHTAHLNAICAGGYGPVGTSFPIAKAGPATLIPAVGDDGIARAIAANKGSIGYVAPNSLRPGELSAAIQNKNGQYYTPTTAAITAAFTSPTDTTPPSGYPTPIFGQQINFYVTNPSASGSYAEVGYAYAFLYTCYPASFGVSAKNVMAKFDNTVYAAGSVTQTGLVNLGSTAKTDALSVIRGIQPGSTYNPTTGKCS